ncbi:glycosyltransferase family 4 protein [Rhodovulum sulfidophilum]|uniref:glycosyltransferase family 4 protein n=1 Tax=Rhodovulum sulfidophilum TaxID=35806 RepID=UPI001922E3D8|nr:glycosyltransferase family 4 protein [Rhodovulum sulfidophilum]MBL3575395.1 glycosyltransferase family 4 protein [Rhodovulum sulfidophilum]MCE8430035.1 glycosyltransferase family 4 protein [Rhodovulum sulfidophilum]MCF4119267.1 glycosyltransferase family 4 protein [Rhodovulum sulfidophilum]
MRKPTVLVIAEAANPEWVSVPLIGWSLASALGEVAETHLVTQIRNREAILRAGLVEGRDFTAIDTEHLMRPVWKLASLLRMGKGKGWTTTTAIAALAYPYFEHLVWQRFGAGIQAGQFDIVHRVTPLTPTTVSPLAARTAAAGVPFVLGPLNGGVPWPRGFDAARRREREWLSYVRGAYRMFPGRRRMLTATAAVLAGSHHTASEIPDACADRVVYLPENAIDPARFNRLAAQDISGPLRAVFIGRLVPYKGPDMAIEATAPLLASGQLQLDMIGDGPMQAELEAQVAALGLGGSVRFHGRLDHARVQDVAAAANLLLFPSIREFGGGVVLEAMSLGVVPLVVDYAGPGELVTTETGYKVPIGPRAEIVRDLRARLEALTEDPSELPQLGRAARDRVLTGFTWAAKAHQVGEVYDWVLGRRPDKPAFAF